jgi:type IV pilus assembly protein PilA
MKFYKQDLGFTLIELLMVIAIIGILSAIAIPIYEIYQNKVKVVSGIAEISAGKVNFETLKMNGDAVSNVAQLNLQSSTTNCNISFTDSATEQAIICTIKNAPPNTNNKTVTLKRVGEGAWQCIAPTIDVLYKPNYCS